MQILVIGKSYSAKRLAEFLSEDKNNIVFSNSVSDKTNYIDITPNTHEEIKDFIIANEVSLLIITDANYMDLGSSDFLLDTECCALYSDPFGTKLCTVSSFGKKFAYKNNLLTSKFSAFEKYTLFLDYLKTANFPLIITPEIINETQSPYIAETKEKAEQYADFLFTADNNKIMTEEYIRGTNYTKYFLIDGFKHLSFIDTISYFDEISTNNTDYIPTVIKEKIDNEIMPNLFNSFMEETENYCGILGITFTISKEDVYFSKFSSFFNDLDIDIVIKTVENLPEVLYKTSTGEIFDNNIIKINSNFAISANINNEFIAADAKTMSRAVQMLEFNGVDKTIINEAIDNWKN